MKYAVKASEKHPLKGGQFDLFRISRREVINRWERDDENGRRWGFEHPDSGEVVAMHPAGTGPVPKLGPVTNAFTVLEIVEEPPTVVFPSFKNLLVPGKKKEEE
jgi:hypothetical protein